MPAIHINRAPERNAFHEQVNNLANDVISNIDAAKKKYDVPSSKDFPNHLVQESSSVTNRNFKSSTRKLGRHNGLKTSHSSPLEVAINNQRNYVVVKTIEQLIDALNAGEKQIDIQAEIHVTDPVLKSGLTNLSLDSSNGQGALIFEGDSYLANNLDNCSLQNLALQFGTVAYPAQNRDFLLANTTQSSLIGGNSIKFNIQAESELGEVDIALFNKLQSSTIINNDIQGTVEITNDVSNAQVLLAVGNSVDLGTSITGNPVSYIDVQSVNPDAVINVEVCDSIADQDNCNVITSSSTTTSTSTTPTTSTTTLSTTTRASTTTPELPSTTTDLPTTPSISGGTGAALTTGAIVGISFGTIGAILGLTAIGYIVYNRYKESLMDEQAAKAVRRSINGNKDSKDSVVAGSSSSSTGSSLDDAPSRSPFAPVGTNVRTPVAPNGKRSAPAAPSVTNEAIQRADAISPPAVPSRKRRASASPNRTSTGHILNAFDEQIQQQPSTSTIMSTQV